MEQPTKALRSRLLMSYQSTLPAIFRSPATWLFVIVYIIAAFLFIISGGGSSSLIIKMPIFIAFYSVIALLVIPLTQNAPVAPWAEQTSYSQNSLRWQVIVLLGFSVATIFFYFLIFGPITTLIHTSNSFSKVLLMIGITFAPLILLGLLPLIAMRLLGCTWSELGFGRGYHSWRVIAVSCCIPLALIIVFIIVGDTTLPKALSQTLHLLIEAGFPEEVFFRGLLLTRLIRLLGTQWGIVLSTFIFGLIHLPNDLANNPNPLQALTILILTQSLAGILFALIFLRTRNILAGAVFHTILDATGL